MVSLLQLTCKISNRYATPLPPLVNQFHLKSTFLIYLMGKALNTMLLLHQSLLDRFPLLSKKCMLFFSVTRLALSVKLLLPPLAPFKPNFPNFPFLNRDHLHPLPHLIFDPYHPLLIPHIFHLPTDLHLVHLIPGLHTLPVLKHAHPNAKYATKLVIQP